MNSFIDSVKNAIQGGEHAFGVNTPGHGAVYNAVQKALASPTAQKVGNWANSSAPAQVQLPHISPQFIQNHPILGYGSLAARTLGQLPLDIGNSVIGEGVINPALDIGKELGGLATHRPVAYRDLKSPALRLGAQLGGLANPTARQADGINENAQNYIGNIAGTASPIINDALLNAGPHLSPDQTLFQKALTSAKFGGEVGAVTGGLGGLSNNRNETLKHQLAQGAQSAATSGIAGAAFGFATPYIGAGLKAAKDGLTKRAPGYVNFDENAPGGGYDPTQNMNRNPNQLALESAMNSGNNKEAMRILDSIPENDPSKGPMEDLFRQKVSEGVLDQTSNPIVPPGSVPDHQAALERAFQEGKWQKAQDIIDTIPPNDPYKAAMQDVLNHSQAVKGARLDGSADFSAPLGDAPLTEADKQAIAHAGEKIDLVPNANKNALGQSYQTTQAANPDASGPSGMEPTTFEDMTNRAEAARQQTDTTGIAPPTTLKDALTSRFAVQQNIAQRSSALQQVIAQAEKTPQDTEIFRQVTENPNLANKLIAQASDPQAMFEAVSQHRDFTKYLYDANKSAGVDLGFRPNYYHHAIDLSNPEDAARYQALVDKKYGKNYQGGYTQPAIFDTVNQIRAAGFKLKNPTALQDVQDLTASNKLRVGNEALFQAVDQAFPGQIQKIGNNFNDPATKNLIPLRIPGMQGTAVTPEVFNTLKNLEPSAFADNNVVKALDAANANLKATTLGGGGFHPLKETARFPFAALAQGKIPHVERGFYALFSPSFRQSELQSAISDGVVDFAGNTGITLSSGSDITPLGTDIGTQAKGLAQKYNNAVFSGLVDNYKMQIVRGMMKHYDLSDPAQLADARAVGQQVNNLFGGLNRTTGDSFIKTATGRQVARFVGLSPDFTEGKIRTLLGALDFRQGNSASARHLAQAGIVGEALVAGALAEIGRRITTGKYSQTIKDAWHNDILDPNFPVPKKLYNTLNNTRQQVVGLPGSVATDINRAVKDPQHFIEARGSSLLSLASKINNNQDYYGKQIFNPNDTVPTKALKLAQTELPIPAVQGLKTLQGKETPAAAITNVIGGRVHTDTNDPSIQILQQRSNYRNTLNQADQAQWDALHPPTTDAAGNKLNPDANPDFTQGPLFSAQKADIYLNHPEFLQTDTKITQASGGNQDPFYTALTPDQQKEVLLLSSGKLLTQQETKQIKSAPWYQPFQTARSAFFDSLPQTNNRTNYATPLDAYNAQRNQIGLPDIAPSAGTAKKPPTSLKGPSIPGAKALRTSRGRKAKVKQAPQLKLARFATFKPTPIRVVKAAAPRVLKLKTVKAPKAKSGFGRRSSYV